MRLIDADRLEHEFMSNMHYLAKDLVKDAAYMVNKAPTIDAVPVVRCKDCKYWSDDAIADECRCNYWKGLFDYCKPDDFCSYGERKDGEG